MQNLAPSDALLVVDIQNDFLPGGALGVQRGDEIIPVILAYIETFMARGLPIFATRDWHPADHCSFREQGGIWPVHCVAGTKGAAPPPSFHLPPSVLMVSKATLRDKEAYSAFEGTSLDADLKEAAVRRLFIGGLATDYCVVNTVKDALALGYQAYVLTDAIRAVNLKPDDGVKATEEMVRAGARLVEQAQVIP